MPLYLLHFNPPYRHAGHYLGFAEDVPTRVQIHRWGLGARLTRVAVMAGCDLQLVRVLPGDRKRERAIKRVRNLAR
jgi:hypothetical protein